MEVISTVVQLAGGAVVTAVALAVSVYYIKPAYIIHFFLRLNTWKAGCTIKYVKVGECQFAYMERGQPSENQPSLLFLHAVDLIAVDLPGHGETGIKAKADLTVTAFVAKLHQFVSVVGLDRGGLHVVGHSMGGGLAGCYAASYPGEVSVLTLSAPAGIKSPVMSPMFDKVAQGKKHLLVPETVEQAEEMFHICLHNKSLIPPKQLVKGFLDYYNTPRMSFLKKMFDALIEDQYALTPLLGKISAPTQVMWGRHEEVLHVTCVDVIKREMTAPLHVDIIEDSGHSIPVETPKKAATLIMNFRDKFLYKQNKS